MQFYVVPSEVSFSENNSHLAQFLQKYSSIAANFRRQQKSAGTMVAGIFAIGGGSCPAADRLNRIGVQNCGIAGCRQLCGLSGK